MSIARLRRLAARAPALGLDGAWLADAIERYLDARGDLTLDEALGVAVLPGGEHWATGEARDRRDTAIRALARIIAPGAKPTSAARSVSSALRRYGASAWRRDQALTESPDGYLGTAKQFIFEAFRAGAGKVPHGESQLRSILASHCSLIETSADKIPGFNRREDAPDCEPKKKEPAA